MVMTTLHQKLHYTIHQKFALSFLLDPDPELFFSYTLNSQHREHVLFHPESHAYAMIEISINLHLIECSLWKQKQQSWLFSLYGTSLNFLGKKPLLQIHIGFLIVCITGFFCNLLASCYFIKAEPISIDLTNLTLVQRVIFP